MPINWTRVINQSWIQLLLLDCSSKLLARNLGMFHENQGISAGLGAGLPNGIIIAVSLTILVWLWQRFDSAAERLILIGGLANLVDRFAFGAVTDWISLPLTHIWFNLADAYISLGLVVFVLGLISTKQKNYEAASANI